MLNLALAVSMGGHALGQVKVEKGEVLYLALEDTARRLQGRLFTILEDGTEPPAGLYLHTEWPRISDGGLDLLRAWLTDYPATRLVIIDTLARIRDRSKARRDVNLYGEDYESLSGLKALADEFTVAIGVVHHDRKSGADDPFDTVSGTLGLTAGPDTIMVLKRGKTAADAVLHVRGRDVEEAKHALRWDGHIGTWSLLDPMAAEVSVERLQLIDALRERGPMRPSEMATWTGGNPGAIRKLVREMAADGQIDGNGTEGYFLPTSVTGNRGNSAHTGNGVTADG